MTTQLSLFDETPREPVSHRPADTRRAAAEAIRPKLGKLQQRYLDYMRTRSHCWGATDHEAAYTLGCPLSSVNARRNELAKLGLIEDSGVRRMGDYGQMVSVWIVTERGKR